MQNARVHLRVLPMYTCVLTTYVVPMYTCVWHMCVMPCAWTTMVREGSHLSHPVFTLRAIETQEEEEGTDYSAPSLPAFCCGHGLLPVAISCWSGGCPWPREEVTHLVTSGKACVVVSAHGLARSQVKPAPGPAMQVAV